jgi:hypothetical protein
MSGRFDSNTAVPRGGHIKKERHHTQNKGTANRRRFIVARTEDVDLTLQQAETRFSAISEECQTSQKPIRHVLS